MVYKAIGVDCLWTKYRGEERRSKTGETSPIFRVRERRRQQGRQRHGQEGRKRAWRGCAVEGNGRESQECSQKAK